MASKEFTDAITAFEETLRECVECSRRCEGIPAPSGAHFYASVLFTTLCTRGMSFGLLIPGTTLARKCVDVWDHASLAILARSLLEVRLAFYYLCAQECTLAEWDYRWNSFNLHDCMSRICLFEELASSSADLPGLRSDAEELRERLQRNEVFLSRSASEQKLALQGRRAYPAALETLAEQAGIPLTTFRVVYRLLSHHVHGLPASFYRVALDGRGRGVHCEAENDYCSLWIVFVRDLLEASLAEMRRLFERCIER